MFANYNYDLFPIVKVIFSQSIQNEEDFNDFLNKWLLLYHNQKDFIFIFDTRLMNNIPLEYSIKMALFIKKLRKQPYHYLQKSFIIVNNNQIKKLLDFIFYMQPPVAPVYIWSTNLDLNDILNQIKNINETNLSENMIYIKPKKPFLPFL